MDRFFELSLDLLCIAGLDGFFRRVNPSWTRVLGWSEAELLSRPVVDFMHPEDRERTLQARARLATGIPVVGLENRYLRKDGSYRWLSWQSSLYSEAGLVVAVARDITERRQSDEERLVLSKLESTGGLAAGIAHDFNNLLASLLLNLELLRLVGPVNDAQASHVRQALETVLTAQGLTRQLVAFADGARAPGHVLDLKPLLHAAPAAASASPNVSFECDIAPDLWPVEAGEVQIKQVVGNLLANALEAMSPGGGVISIKARNIVSDAAQSGGAAVGVEQVCFVVSDRGPGIPPETREKVFDPYFSTKRRGPQKGMGLGLTICHAILRQHGGQILVDSNPGGGTSVRCCLPAARGAAWSGAGTGAAAPAAANGRRVLVMDDEPWLRDAMTQALARIGYGAEAARDRDEAIRLFQAARESGNPFVAVVLDLSVRGDMGGRELLRVLRERVPGLPAILMVGRGGASAASEAGQPVFQAFLAKPFTVEGLREALAVALGGGPPR